MDKRYFVVEFKDATRMSVRCDLRADGTWQAFWNDGLQPSMAPASGSTAEEALWDLLSEGEDVVEVHDTTERWARARAREQRGQTKVTVQLHSTKQSH
jgi:hypothetical protein